MFRRERHASRAHGSFHLFAALYASHVSCALRLAGGGCLFSKRDPVAELELLAPPPQRMVLARVGRTTTEDAVRKAMEAVWGQEHWLR